MRVPTPSVRRPRGLPSRSTKVLSEVSGNELGLRHPASHSFSWRKLEKLMRRFLAIFHGDWFEIRILLLNNGNLSERNVISSVQIYFFLRLTNSMLTFSLPSKNRQRQQVGVLRYFREMHVDLQIDYMRMLVRLGSDHKTFVYNARSTRGRYHFIFETSGGTFSKAMKDWAWRPYTGLFGG